MRSSIAALKATEKVLYLPSGKRQEFVYAQRQTSAHSEDEFMSVANCAARSPRLRAPTL